MEFRSAVDWWFYAVTAATAVVVALAMFPLLKSGQVGQIAVAGVTALVAVGLPLWLLASTYYRVSAGSLEVRSGPFRWTIPLNEITEVRKSRSALSSPALSLDRMEVKYGRGRSILLSPRDRGGFLKAIGQTLRTE
jgi:hypothetical protein